MGEERGAYAQLLLRRERGGKSAGGDNTAGLEDITPSEISESETDAARIVGFTELRSKVRLPGLAEGRAPLGGREVSVMGDE